jgi:uncharacterized protein with ParB-like and HNH nuclease domain
MKYESISIKKAVQMIDDKKLLLPHIQRPFVWKNDQVKRFFDSIMRDYPFGTLLFWTTKDDIQLRKFIDNYKDNMDVKSSYIKSSEYKNIEKSLVLDGQQRLQALYIALKGSYNNKELYFDVLSGDKIFWDGQDELKYRFDYFTKEEAKENNNKNSHWILLKSIVLSDESSTKIKRDILNRMIKEGIDTDKVEEKVEDNISKVKNLFSEMELIYYYPIDSTIGKIIDYEEILEIFIRANSGGTILSKSDLMFSLIKLSWDDAEEEFEDLLKVMNKQGGFYFSKDFILKASLVLLDKSAKYAVDKFKGDAGEQNLKTIKNNWTKIVDSFRWMKDFLTYAQINSDDTLPSYNSLIPIVYYAYIHNNKPKSPKTKYNIQTWLYKALLNGNFRGQSDRVIDNCTDLIKQHSRIDYFPFKELEDNMKNKLNRVVDINLNIIDANVYLILNLVYLFNKQVTNFQPVLNGNSPEIDHIFPKSKMLKTYKYPSNLVNNIGNYMFLEKSLNISKLNKLPEEYFPIAVKAQRDFFDRNSIPEASQLHKPDKFQDFVTLRRKALYNTILRVLLYQ